MVRAPSFDRILQDKNWVEISSRVMSRGPEHAHRALRALYNDPNVPARLIRVIFQKLKSHPSEGTGTPYRLFPFVRPLTENNFDEFCREVCIRARFDVFKEFLVSLAGSYKTPTLGRDYKWPSPQSIRAMISRVWFGGLSSLEDPNQLLEVSSLDELAAAPELHDIWKKTELLIMASAGRNINSETMDGTEWLVVHAATNVPCASSVLWFALKLYSDQISRRDHFGRLPLHYAATNLVEVPVFSLPQKIRKEVPQRLVFDFLYDLYPKAIELADSQGKRPLLIALESHNWWRLVDSSKETLDDWMVSSWKNAAFSRLVKHSSEILMMRDTETHFWPFLQAAAEGAPVNAIYCLLRENPAPLMYRQEETTLSYLRKRLLVVEEENVGLVEQLKQEKNKTTRLEEEVMRLTQKYEPNGGNVESPSRLKSCKRPRI